jgi:Holliday junction resolvasome RuvABC endonuclease subunit
MKPQAWSQGLIMAVHPYARGFGWVLFEKPRYLANWGIVEIKKDRNARCLARIDQILRRYEPSVIALEQFDGRPARRSARVKDLCIGIAELAANRKVANPIYSRATVRACFSGNAKETRYAIAQIIAMQFPELRRYLPPSRRAWQSEDCRQCLFDAAALAVTHFAAHGHPP